MPRRAPLGRMRRLASAVMDRVGLEKIEHDSAGFRVPTTFLKSGYLSDVGWFRSVEERRVVDAAGQPIPWMVYPAIDLLSSRLPIGAFAVFEYGSGASTMWWSRRAAVVVSVEHDRQWYEQVAASVPPNVALMHVPLEDGDRYERAVLEPDAAFDVVVIDGRRRTECSKHVVGKLTDRGVIIWDNSDRPRYREGLARFAAAGWKQLDLRGMAPRDTISSVTGLLYRDGNLLGL